MSQKNVEGSGPMRPSSSADGYAKDGEFTVVEDPQAGPRALTVRRVTDKERRMVWRWGGFLFTTVADAEQFAKDESIFDPDRAPFVRQAFSHKRVDGRRIYVHQGSVGGGGW